MICPPKVRQKTFGIDRHISIINSTKHKFIYFATLNSIIINKILDYFFAYLILVTIFALWIYHYMTTHKFSPI